MFLRKCTHCPVVLWLRDVKVKPDQVHHMRGRLGPLLLDQRYWLGVCDEGHRWIDANRAKAREMGWLCKVGDWNRID